MDDQDWKTVGRWMMGYLTPPAVWGGGIIFMLSGWLWGYPTCLWVGLAGWFAIGFVLSRPSDEEQESLTWRKKVRADQKAAAEWAKQKVAMGRTKPGCQCIDDACAAHKGRGWCANDGVLTPEATHLAVREMLVCEACGEYMMGTKWYRQPKRRRRESRAKAIDPPR